MVNKKEEVIAALAALRRAHEAVKAAEAARVRAVIEARSAGATWQEIADAVEMQQPNATRKFKPLVIDKGRLV